ncbi:MAG: hypothetical protein GF307_08905 [candidate division Zixibacteria bacterium]|nr:hypothetical protein [candidate division Zixibacteria bacterium]
MLSKYPVIAIILLLTVFGVIYILTIPANHTEAEDSLSILNDIRSVDVEKLFHPHHLLYAPVGYTAHHLAQSAGINTNLQLTMQAVNIFAGLFVLLMVYLIAGKLNMAPYLRAIAVFITAFSYSFWRYSNECETYIIPLVFIMLVIAGVIRMFEKGHSYGRAFWLGIGTAFAVLFHQQHIVFIIPLTIAFLISSFDSERKYSTGIIIKNYLLCLLTFVFVLTFAYSLVGFIVLGKGNFTELRQWFTGYAYGGVWGAWSFYSIPKAVIGLGRSFIGGHFIFALAPAREFIQSTMPDYVLREEVFLVRDFSGFKSWLLIISTFAFVLSAAFMFFRAVWHRFSRAEIELYDDNRPDMRYLVFLYCILIVYAAFNIWWEPQNIEFWIAVMPALGLLFCYFIGPVLNFRFYRNVAVVFMALLFAINLFGSIAPQKTEDNDYWRDYNSWYLQHCRKGDLIFAGDGHLSDSYIEYYTGAEAISLLPVKWHYESLTQVYNSFDSVLTAVNPRRVFISSTMLEPNPELVKRYELDMSFSRHLFETLLPRLDIIYTDDNYSVYKLLNLSDYKDRIGLK